MIIGCYHGDGTPVEEVDLRDKGRMFELEVCTVKHPRRQRYTYDVDHESIAFCASKESAEQMIHDILLSEEDGLKDIYCWYLYERVLDVKYDRNEYMSCWLYDKSGEMTRYSFGVTPYLRLKIRQKWGTSLNPLS